MKKEIKKKARYNFVYLNINKKKIFKKRKKKKKKKKKKKLT